MFDPQRKIDTITQATPSAGVGISVVGGHVVAAIVC